MSLRVSPPDESLARSGTLRRGLLAPSLLAVVAGLVLAVAAIVVLLWTVTSGAFSVIPAGYLLRDLNDDFLVVSHRVGALKRQPPQGVPVYVLGGSVTNEMIQTPEGLEAQLSRLSGRKVSVSWLASFSQSLGQTLAIVENLPAGPGLVVIGVSPNRFSARSFMSDDQVTGKPFLMESTALRDEVVSGWRRRLPVCIWPGVADYLATYSQTLLKRVRHGDLPPFEYAQHRYTEGDQVSLVAKREQRQTGVDRGLPGIQERFPYNARLLEATVALARKRGMQVVVLEMPLDEEVVQGAWDPALDTYQPFCRDVAARYGGTYVDFSQDVCLVNRDFADLFHLVESGRAKWQPRLVTELVPWIDRAAGGETSGSSPAP
jgi:hypothetical protein